MKVGSDYLIQLCWLNVGQSSFEDLGESRGTDRPSYIYRRLVLYLMKYISQMHLAMTHASTISLIFCMSGCPINVNSHVLSIRNS